MAMLGRPRILDKPRLSHCSGTNEHEQCEGCVFANSNGAACAMFEDVDFHFDQTVPHRTPSNLRREEEGFEKFLGGCLLTWDSAECPAYRKRGM